MPFDFDAEYGDDPDVATAAASVVENLTTVVEATPESIDEHMSEVEKRLEVASYYRMLLNDSLFTDASAAGRTVEAEVRAFIKERLAVLLNIKAPRPEPVEAKLPFNHDQVQALIALANKVIGKPGLIETAPAPARAPAVRRVETVPQPQSSSTPAVRQRRGPAQSQPAIPAAVPAPKPAPKPAARKPGERRYSEHTKEDGTKVKLDVTGQVRSPTSLPMPTGPALAAITAARAQENLSRLEIVETSGAGSRAGTHLVQTAIAASLVQKENE